MPRTRCAFCEHDNPPGSKYCNECGSPLHLAPCARCDAVNDVDARACHRCGAPPALRAARDSRSGGADATVSGATHAHVPETFARLAESAAPVGAAPHAAHAPQPPLRPPPAQGVSPPRAMAATSATPESFVVPPDEARLAATRDMAVAASRRRAVRNAVIAILAVAAVPVLYFEFIATDAVAQWLHRTQANVASAIRARFAAPAATSAEVPSGGAVPARNGDTGAGKAQAAPAAAARPAEAAPSEAPAPAAQPTEGAPSEAPAAQPATVPAAASTPVVPVNAGADETTPPPPR